MLKIFTQISRFIIGLVFVYSGFVKLVDPMGTQFKMTEYFEVLNMEFFTPYALPISILLILAELVLGIMILVGYKSKFAVWSIFLLTLMFLFLTWYSHTYQVVTDCGCFGDALKLTTGETFYKNVVFIGLIIIMIFGLRYIKPLFSNKFASLTTFLSVGFSVAIIFYVLNHLPLIDFRPYAVGNSIEEGMKVVKGEDIPPIHDFMVETADGDQLPRLLKKDKVMLVIMYSFEKAEKEAFPEISKIAGLAEILGYEVYILTDVPEEYLQKTPEELWLPFKFASCDGTALKTAIRANPGIMTIENGIIIGKWNWKDVDKVELHNPYN